MIEKVMTGGTDVAIKGAMAVEKQVEGLFKKAWSIMDAAAVKERPSQYLSERGLRALQGISE